MSKKNIYKITFILAPFILAFAFHFLYEYISFPLFAIYSPVNESVFEHIKLTFTPFILTFLIFYLIFKNHLDKTKFLSCLIIAISTATVTMLSLYYLFNIFSNDENMFLNILSLLAAVIVGQLLSILAYNKNIKWSKEISIYSLITMTVILLIFTVNPPYLSFFFDTENLTYGILK